MADDWNQGEDNNNPEKQAKDMPAIKATDPRGDQNNKAAVPHQALESADKSKQESGKDIGLVNAPVQSVHPTSGLQGVMSDDEEEPDYEIIDVKRPGEGEYRYPIDQLEAGQALFAPVPKGSTTDKLMAELRDMAWKYREQGGEIETDENGDQVRESVVIETRKRTDDGLLQLDGAGRPIVGANQTNRYKMIYSSNFTVKAVVKGDEIGDTEAESDGVLVTRVF